MPASFAVILSPYSGWKTVCEVFLKNFAKPLLKNYAPANIAFNFETMPVRAGALRRAFAPYKTNPTAVAYSGCATCSGKS